MVRVLKFEVYGFTDNIITYKRRRRICVMCLRLNMGRKETW
jgi:hypothetical protein